VNLQSGFDNLAQTSAAAATALVGAVFGIQKLLKTWKGSSAELDVITAMHEELNRLSAYNKTLSEELGKVQVDFLNINKEMRVLSEENQKLHYEVNGLTLEVKRLNNLLIS
jgi:predicted nuclease with TOPRIM domain